MNYDEAFDELVSLWPAKGGKTEARAAFDYLVNGTYEDPNAQFVSVRTQLQLDRKTDWSGLLLGAYLIKKHGLRIATSPGVSKSTAPRSQGIVVSTIPATHDSLKGFDEIFSARPVRANHRPERIKYAQQAWVGAVARLGGKVEVVIAACKAWIETEGRLEHPRNLTTFLNDEDLLSYADHARSLPSEGDVSDFEEAYSLYPGFKTDDANLVLARRDHYTAVIPVDDRFKFLAAVATYARTNPDDQYVQKWSNFVAGSWNDIDYKRVLHRSLAIALAEETNGVVNVVDHKPASESSVPQMVRGWVSRYNEYLSDARKRYADWQPSGNEIEDERPRQPEGDVTVDVERVLLRARANLSKGL